MKSIGCALIGVFLSCYLPLSAESGKALKEPAMTVVPFGNGGQLKMIYDRRQRPQAVYMNDRVYMVYNGGAEKGESKTYPFVISYDPQINFLGEPIQLDDKSSKDQHYCPIIWADKHETLHLLYGCHKTPGTHLVSKKPGEIGSSSADWTESSQIRHSLSYPTIYHIYDGKQLMYFRSGEHRSSWSYLISDDDASTWSAPVNDVVDLNMGGDGHDTQKEVMGDEMSSYHTVLPSRDGRYLHVAFCSYDDNKGNVPERFYNPRYKTTSNFSFKYNLYYVKVNLLTGEVENFAGEKIKTPVDYETAKAKCMIWDTAWRGAGVPPDMILDGKGNPAFLHVLSGDTPTEFNYYYVQLEDNKWKHTLIAPSSDDWNSCYLREDAEGKIYACLVMGEPFFKGGDTENSNSMDSRGGGDIVEWISTDKGKTWRKNKDLTPRGPEYAGWKFNNIQPIKRADQTEVEGMFLFYGWKDPGARTAKAFLLVENN
jgi:hypothetical protein